MEERRRRTRRPQDDPDKPKAGPHHPTLTVDDPKVVVVQSNGSWAELTLRIAYDPQAPIGGGMVSRGSLTFPGGILRDIPGRVLLRLDCQAQDVMPAHPAGALIHLTARVNNEDITQGATGMPRPPDYWDGGQQAGSIFGNFANGLPYDNLKKGWFQFRDGNPARGMLLLLLECIPSTSQQLVLTITATCSGGSDQNSLVIHE